MPHLELNLAPTAEDMPDMALALIRAIIAAADKDQDEMTVLLIHGEPAAVIAPYGHERRAGAMLCRLVAHHSHAIVEAEERGLADILALEFEPAPYALSGVLTCCDMTTSPDGELVPAERRLAEIHDRYGPGDLVSRSIRRATPMICRAVEQVHDRAARTA